MNSTDIQEYLLSDGRLWIATRTYSVPRLVPRFPIVFKLVGPLEHSGPVHRLPSFRIQFFENFRPRPLFPDRSGGQGAEEARCQIPYFDDVKGEVEIASW
jgi:hypothetical protein